MMDKNTRGVMFSSRSDEYETPKWLYTVLDNIFMFDLDPAASALSHMNDKYYTIADDGLSKDWSGETWYINPPYSKARDWIAHASDGFLSGTSNGVILVPARTETNYWHKYIWPVAHYILFLKGRLKFINKTLPSYGKGGKPSSAPYPSAVIIYVRPWLFPEEKDTLSKYGHLINLWSDQL